MINEIVKKNIITTGFVLSLWAVSLLVNAQDANVDKSKATLDATLAQATLVRNIAPVFGQLVSFPLPKGFIPVFENTKDNFYIWEAVPSGETVEKWTQMLTMTGIKGISSNPKINPQQVAFNIAGGFQRSCADTFAGTGVGITKIGGNDAFGVLVTCGIANPQKPKEEQYSETAMIIAIKGETSYYTMQWAERGLPDTTKKPFDAPKWTSRSKQFESTRLCAIVPSESSPYPSCK
jgi:hypothetical protein